MSNTSKQSPMPRAMVHKRILDEATDHPDESLNAIADKVPSATTDLVERVLDEYGDPAATNDGQVEGTENEAQVEVDDTVSVKQPEYVDIDRLSDKQYETLRVIHKHPDETQREIADRLGVSGSTINNRVNSIDGFRWESRQAYTTAVFNTMSGSTPESQPAASADQNEIEDEVSQLAERLTAIEERLEEMTATDESSCEFETPKLTRKVVQACMKSDNITEDEELQILKKFI